MRKLKYVKLFENLDESVYSEIQKMIDENQFLKGKVTADKNTVFEAGDFILLLSDLGHITDAHVDEKIPGSKFEKGVDLKKAIVSLVSNNKPNELFKGNEKVTDSKQADKFKWLGLDTKVPVGIENVHKLDVNSDEFKDLKVYIYKDSRGNEFKIKVKEGEGDKTTFLSFIGGKIGEIGGKPVLSVITAFPGKNGSTIANRNDFMKSGYYFTTQSKEVLSSEVKESKRFKHLKTFESFSTNEGKITDRIKDAFKSKSTKEKEKKEADLQSEYAKLLRDLRIKWDLVELLEYIQDMVTPGKALDLYDSERLIEKTFDLEKMGQASEYYDGTNKSFRGEKSVRSAMDEIGYLDITSQEVVTTKQKTQIDNKLKSVMSEVKDLEEKLKKLKNFFSTNEGKITDRIKDAFKSKSTKDQINVFKAIDICRDNGFELDGGSTDGHSWQYPKFGVNSLVITPDYRKGYVKIYGSAERKEYRDRPTIASIKFSNPEDMAKEIMQCLLENPVLPKENIQVKIEKVKAPEVDKAQNTWTLLDLEKLTKNASANAPGRPDPEHIAKFIPTMSIELSPAFKQVKDKILAGDIVKIKRNGDPYRSSFTGYTALLDDGRTIRTLIRYLWDFGDSGSSDGMEGHFLSISDKTFDDIRNRQLPLFNKFRKSGFSSGINYFMNSFNDKHDNPILIDKKTYKFINSLLEEFHLKTVIT